MEISPVLSVDVEENPVRLFEAASAEAVLLAASSPMAGSELALVPDATYPDWPPFAEVALDEEALECAFAYFLPLIYVRLIQSTGVLCMG